MSKQKNSMCSLLLISSEKQISVQKVWTEVKNGRISAPMPVNGTYFVQIAKHFSILCTFGELLRMQVKQNFSEITMKDYLSLSNENR